MGDLRDVDLGMLVLVEIPLDKVLEVPQAHLPRLALLDLHLVEAAVSYPFPHVLLEPVVEEGAAAEAARADGGFLDSERLEGYYLVGDQTIRVLASYLHNWLTS